MVKEKEALKVLFAFKIHERRMNKRDKIMRDFSYETISPMLTHKMNQRERWNEKNNNSHVAKVKTLRIGL